MKSLILLFIAIFIIIIKINAQVFSNIDSAYMHLKEQFNQYNKVTYVYKDDNCGGNIYIPSIFEGEFKNTVVNQNYIDTSFNGRSCTKIILKPETSFSSVKYVYPENNSGTYHGYDISNTTKLSFYAKGNGMVEFMLGGANRSPFNKDTLAYQDGADIHSTGIVKLTNNWKQYTIDLSDNRLWVYLNSSAGLKNKYCKPVFMPDSNKYFNFRYADDDGTGIKCMKLYWFGGNENSAGVFLFPPEGDWNGTQGYDLTGIKKIRFKAKISQPGHIKFLFAKDGDSKRQVKKVIFLSNNWQWYDWELPSGNYKNIVGGFGFYVGGDLNTPNLSSVFIDSLYYEGVELAHDYSNLICGFNISATKSLNPDSAVIYIDEVKYNKDRSNQPHFCQSFVCGSDSIDITLKNRSDVYDNALKLIVDLMMFKKTNDSSYLFSANLIGDAFIFAQNHDRKFHDGRLRNSYMCGDIKHWDNTARMPGWWDYVANKWFEDQTCLSTSTGNMAWAGLALTTLYEATNATQYLTAAKTIADWCINNTGSNKGFTGGYEDYDSIQKKVTWKSTEHNMDLYALFKRLYYITIDNKYNNAALSADNLVKSMWDSINHIFWTGTINDGITPNKSVIPLDIQAWYLMAYKDSTSNYSNCINWVNPNCYLSNFKSPNYSKNLNGFDFNTDKDGIWFEGTAQVALAFSMKGNYILADSLLLSIEYIQSHNNNKHFYNVNNKGIVAADHNNTSTGFNWNYHNRLHIGATCWYIIAKLKKNPYYY